MDAGAPVLVTVGGDSLDEQPDKLSPLLEGFYGVALYFREVWLRALAAIPLSAR